MAEKRISPSPTEMSTLSSRIAEANLAQARLQEVFTMFCEGHGASGASFVGIENGEVVLDVPDISPVQESAA